MQNVLLVTVDSLRADRICQEIMPKTHGFAEGALEFTDCVANGSSTPASFPSILASRHFASIDGLGIPEDGEVTTIAERMADSGYRTAGFTDNHFAGSTYHFDRGFDYMHDASSAVESGKLKQFVQTNLDREGALFRIIERGYNFVDGIVSENIGGSEYERADSLNRRGLSWIDDGEGDWFTWLHYMDAHHPYEAPPEYQEEFLDDSLSVAKCRSLSRKATHHPEEMSDDDWDRLEGLYDAECRYVDRQFAELLSELEERGVRDETLILFTADHGELFGEHGKGGHPAEFWEGVIRVPFLLEGVGESGTVSQQTRLLDTAPTLADACGLDSVEEWAGSSLLPLTEGEEHDPLAFGDVGRDIDYEQGYVRRSDGWKLLDHHDDGEFLFNVKETPEELRNDERSSDSPEVLNELRERISQHRTRMTELRHGARGVAETEEVVEEHLEDLGYL